MWGGHAWRARGARPYNWICGQSPMGSRGRAPNPLLSSKNSPDLHQSQEGPLAKVGWTCPPQCTPWRRPAIYSSYIPGTICQLLSCQLEVSSVIWLFDPVSVAQLGTQTLLDQVTSGPGCVLITWHFMDYNRLLLYSQLIDTHLASYTLQGMWCIDDIHHPSSQGTSQGRGNQPEFSLYHTAKKWCWPFNDEN